MKWKSKFREIELKKGLRILLGKNAESNDELVKKFKGKGNFILHTSAPGSPFGVIEKESGTAVTRKEIKSAGAEVAARSQDWRDNKKDVQIDVFTGKDISKPFFAKAGLWKVKKSKKIKIKKSEIGKVEKGKNAAKPSPTRKKRDNR